MFSLTLRHPRHGVALVDDAVPCSDGQRWQGRAVLPSGLSSTLGDDSWSAAQSHLRGRLQTAQPNPTCSRAPRSTLGLVDDAVPRSDGQRWQRSADLPSGLPGTLGDDSWSAAQSCLRGRLQTAQPNPTPRLDIWGASDEGLKRTAPPARHPRSRLSFAPNAWSPEGQDLCFGST